MRSISKKNRQSSGKMPRELPINALKYSGPINTSAYKQACDVHTFVVHNSGQLTSSAGGVLNTVFTNSNQAGASADWTGLSALFKEYRILAMQIDYIPWNQYSKASTTVVTPLYVVSDRETATALTSVADAVGSASCRIYSLDNKWSRSIRMDGVEESQWTVSGSAVASTACTYLKCYASGLSNSTIYGDFISSCVVQFRNL